MKKLLFLFVIFSLVFACQPVMAHQIPGTSTYTTEGHSLDGPATGELDSVPESLVPMTEKYQFKWYQTTTLVSGLYMLMYLLPEDDPRYRVEEPYSVDVFWVTSTDGSRAITETFNMEPLTQPDQIVGLFYFDIDTWVKIDLPCKFGEIYPRRNPLEFSGPTIDI